MQNPTARNHYVPQFYLARFCDTSGRVLRTLRGPDDKLYERRFTPRQTGYEYHLYSLMDAGPIFREPMPDVIERDVMLPIDTNGAQVVTRLRACAPSELTPEERADFALFLNSLLERHPQRIREGDLRAEQAAERRVAELRHDFGPPHPGRPDLFELLDAKQLGRNLHRAHVAREIRNPKSLEYLGGLMMAKLTIEPNPVLSFVTGDNHVLVNLGEPWPLNFFTLALAPDTLLLGINDKGLPPIETILKLAVLHNIELFKQCEYVFSREALQDNEGVKTRTAAATTLKPTPWRTDAHQPR